MSDKKATENKTASEPAKRGPRPARKYIKITDGTEWLITKSDLDKFLDAIILWHCNNKQGPFPHPKDFNAEPPQSLMAFHITEKESPLDILKLKSIFASGKDDEATTIQPQTDKPNK